MGAWGYGPVENDAAQDLILDAEETGDLREGLRALGAVAAAALVGAPYRAALGP